jgi:GT2 family glycosyltransferase
MMVSFVIPLYNCLPLTQAMLASLRTTLPAGTTHEIIFVDDGSTDGTREWLATLPAPCRFILNEKNLGFAGACNRAAAAATGEFIFFLNNDLVLTSHWLEPMLAAFTRFKNVGLVGNVQRNFATGAIDHTGIYFDHKGKPAHGKRLPFSTLLFGAPAYRSVDALTAACFGIRRATWQSLGGFDDGFINGGEDIDLCLRATEHGLTNYVALRSVVFHHISQSSGRKLRDEQNTARLVERWHEKIAALSSHAWSRQQIIAHADQSGVFDYAMVQTALFHYLNAGKPPARVNEGVRSALEVERRRWRELLQGEAAPVVHHHQRTDLI